MNKKRLIITSVISIFLVSVLLIGSTYSIFTSEEIDETANVYKTGDLEVSYSESGEIQVDPIPKSEEEADGITPYRITVTNNGNVPYKFDVILNDTTSNTNNTINYDYIMTKVGYLEPKALGDCTDNIIKEDVVLLAGESVDIDIRVWVSDTIPNSEMGKSFYAKLTIDGLAVYNDSKEINNDNLSLRYMKNLFAGGDDHSYYRNDAYREKIKTAAFVDYIDTSNAISSAIWDVSLDSDNSVVAWLENNETSGYYDLYIGANNEIYVGDLQSFFHEMEKLESIIFLNINTSLTTGMERVFLKCSSLEVLDVSKFNTSNVTSMVGMFYSCSKLTTLDLSNFDTSNVTNIRNIFSYCSSLTSLDVSNFDTSNITNMSGMFLGCSGLTSLDLSNFDTSNVTNMARMFQDSSNLTSLDLSNFDTSNVTSMHYMFGGCRKLDNLDVSSFNTSNVGDMEYMFFQCFKLRNLDITNFDTSNVTRMSAMFYDCSRLITTINIKTTSATYTEIFTKSAIETGAIITVNYTSASSSLVDSMIATKSENSNVVKGNIIT